MSYSYIEDTYETDSINLISNPIHCGVKEPMLWYELTALMKSAKSRFKLHTPYIICNQMMYDTLAEAAANVQASSIMTNSAANNGNPFGASDYSDNRDKILSLGMDVWEYEGGYSYHGKSLIIDDDISVVGSFNIDMRSVYLDTELMLVINSREINGKLSEEMHYYEKSARQALENGEYINMYNVKPVELSDKRRKRMFFVRTFISWARFLF